MGRLYFYLMPVAVLLLCIDQSISYTKDPEAGLLSLVALWLCWVMLVVSCRDAIRVSRGTESFARFRGLEGAE